MNFTINQWSWSVNFLRYWNNDEVIQNVSSICITEVKSGKAIKTSSTWVHVLSIGFGQQFSTLKTRYLLRSTKNWQFWTTSKTLNGYLKGLQRPDLLLGNVSPLLINLHEQIKWICFDQIGSSRISTMAWQKYNNAPEFDFPGFIF